MRPLLKHAMTGLAVCAALAMAAPMGQPAGAQTSDDVLVLGSRIDDIITLDPAEVPEFSGAEVANNVYDRITSYEPGNYGELVGGVAERWDISEDGKTLSFTVREGMTFHSGNRCVPRTPRSRCAGWSS